MKTFSKMPWWLVILTGVLILGAGIFLLVANTPGDTNKALDTLMFIVGFIVFAYGVFNLYKAFKLKNDHRLFVAHLIHGILDIVLLLLILFIPDSQALLGVILACWFIVFGLFGLVQTDQSSENHRQSRRISVLLLVIGLVLLIFPLALKIDYILLLGIACIIIGAVRTVQGILLKTRYDDRTSGGRSNLY